VATIQYVVNAIDSASATFSRIAGSVEDLNDKLKALSDKSATARVALDGDGKAKLALDDIELRMARLANRLAKPKITLEGQHQALLQIAALNLELDKLNSKKADPAAGGGGVLSNLLSKGAGAIGGALGNIPVVGGALGSLSNAGGIAGGTTALLAAVSAAQALLVALLALGTGFIAAGLGIAALGALAIPAISAITAALSATPAQLAKLPAPIQTAVASINNLRTSFDAMAQKMQPQLFTIFNIGLGIANQLLPYVAKFAAAAAPAVAGLMKALSTQISSAGFKDFMGRLSAITPAAITAIGAGVGKLAVDFMQLLSIMGKKDVVQAITIAFQILNIAMQVIIGVIRITMNEWDSVTAAFRRVASWADFLGVHMHAVAGMFRKDGTEMAGAVSAAMNFITGIIKSFVNGAIGVFHQLENTVLGIFHAAANAWEHAFNAPFEHILRTLGDFGIKGAGIVLGFAGKVQNYFLNMASNITGSVVKFAFNIAVAFGNMVTSAANAVSGLAGRVWNAAFQPVLNFIGSFASTAAGAMWSAGSNLIGGLISGIESQISGLESLMSHLANDVINNPVTRFFGIKSPSTLFMSHGQNIIRGLTAGINAGLPSVQQAMGHVNAAVSDGTGYGRPAGARSVTVNINVSVPVGGSPRDTGRAVADVLKAYVKGGGQLYPAGVTPR
jgi:hypothetical protein